MKKKYSRAGLLMASVAVGGFLSVINPAVAQAASGNIYPNYSNALCGSGWGVNSINVYSTSSNYRTGWVNQRWAPVLQYGNGQTTLRANLDCRSGSKSKIVSVDRTIYAELWRSYYF